MNPHYPAWFGFMLALLLTACWSEPPTPTPTAVPLPIATPTVSAIVRACQAARPADWAPYTVEDGDTLSDLAEVRDTTVEQLKQVNCLTSDLIVADETLYLPPPCQISPPTSWVEYQVRPGDTLFTLAEQRRTSVAEIARVNCLQAEDILNISQSLYLPAPPPPTLTPIPTDTPTPLPPPPPTPLPTPLPIPTMPLIRPTPGIVAFNPTPATQSSTNLSSDLGVQAPANPDSPQGGQPSNETPVINRADTPPGKTSPNEILDFPPEWPLMIQRPDIPNSNDEDPVLAQSAQQLNQFAGYKPCSKGVLDFLPTKREFELGEHPYLFICADEEIVSVKITLDSPPQDPPVMNSLKVLTETPHLDLPNPISETGKYTGVVDFPVLPDEYPPGKYSLKLIGKDNSVVLTRTIGITDVMSQPHILIRPPQDPTQNTYLIYYVGFTSTLTNPHFFGLYHEIPKPGLDVRVTPGPKAISRTYERWKPMGFLPTPGTIIKLSPGGGTSWFTSTLTLSSTDPITGAYGIGWEYQHEKNKVLEPDWLFWPELLRRQAGQ